MQTTLRFPYCPVITPARAFFLVYLLHSRTTRISTSSSTASAFASSVACSVVIMSISYRLGQVLKGRLATYTLTKEIYNTVWLASYAQHRLTTEDRSLTSHRNSSGETVVIKGVNHSRIKTERDVLRKYQDRLPIRPLVDEILEPTEPPGIVLKYLESDLMSVSSKKTLNRSEIKYVARIVLTTLAALHQDGYVHTGAHQSQAHT
jgi:hypothetical protein